MSDLDPVALSAELEFVGFVETHTTQLDTPEVYEELDQSPNTVYRRGLYQVVGGFVLPVFDEISFEVWGWSGEPGSVADEDERDDGAVFHHIEFTFKDELISKIHHGGMRLAAANASEGADGMGPEIVNAFTLQTMANFTIMERAGLIVKKPAN